MAPKRGRNIILIGMPGVGKTTVGEILARLLGKIFLDIDHLIEAGEGRTLQSILDEEGVAAFCALEARYGMALALRNHVVGTGGSMVYQDDAMRHLKQLGTVIHLDASAELVESRLGNLATRGTVRAPGQSIASLHRERTPLYARYADMRIVCDGLSPEAVARRIVDMLASVAQ